MKKALLTTLLVTAATAAFGQGSVTFNNALALFSDGKDRYVYMENLGGQKLVGQNFKAELWYAEGANAGASALSAAANSIKSFRAPTTSTPGTWSGGSVTLQGIDIGETATLQVRVWDGATAATWAAAAADVNIKKGMSNPFNYTVPPAGSLPAEYTLKGLNAFYVTAIPEPSVIALGVLGLGALVLFRRRKN